MNKVIINEKIFDTLPTIKVGVLIAKGIKNEDSDVEKYNIMLRESKSLSKKYTSNDEFAENKVVKIWRETYSKFKTKKGARSSIESLLKRAKNGFDLQSINPLVDIYNSASLRFGFPCGGEDIDKIVNNMSLDYAIGDEEFITYGSDKSEPPYPGEIIWKDDNGVICRCLNWREGVRTVLTSETTNAALIVETIDEENNDRLNKIMEFLGENIKSNLGGDYKYQIIDASNSQMEITK